MLNSPAAYVLRSQAAAYVQGSAATVIIAAAVCVLGSPVAACSRTGSARWRLLLDCQRPLLLHSARSHSSSVKAVRTAHMQACRVSACKT